MLFGVCVSLNAELCFKPLSFIINPVNAMAFVQVVKYFLDTKTFNKVKFVYPKNKDSVELMKTYFDVDNLPTEFGGKTTLNYDHEEFSRLMAEDDIKSAKLWGFDGKQKPAYSGAEVVPEPETLASAAS